MTVITLTCRGISIPKGSYDSSFPVGAQMSLGARVSVPFTHVQLLALCQMPLQNTGILWSPVPGIYKKSMSEWKCSFYPSLPWNICFRIGDCICYIYLSSVYYCLSSDLLLFSFHALSRV